MDANPAARKSAPYGHACAGCSKAKCRCIGRGPAGTSCERCNRLNKECQPSTVVRKRPVRRVVSATSRKTSGLEAKLDDLVTLLKSQAVVAAASSSTETASGATQRPANGIVPPTGQLNSQPHTGSLCQPTVVQDSSSSPSFLSGTSSSYAATPPGFLPPQVEGSTELTIMEAESILKTFKECHLKTFPFLDLPDHLNIGSFQREQPCLWLAIRVILSRSSSEKHILDTQFRNLIGQRMLVEADRNMDMLQGLITWLSWMMDHNREKKTLCLFSNIACSLVFDLRLDRTAGQEYPCKETSAAFAYSFPVKSRAPAPKRTNQERRTVLACFCICTSIADFLRSQSMRWTPHMEDCLQHLINNPELPGDRTLAAITQILQVTDDMLVAYNSRFFEVEAGLTPKAPLMIYVKSLSSRLDAVTKSIPPEILSDKFVQSYVTCAVASINELGLPYLYDPTDTSGSYDHRNSECVFACIESSKQCLENGVFALSSDDCLGLTLMIVIHLARCTHILYRLCITQHPSVDRQMVRNSVDLFGLMEKIAEKFSKAAHAKGAYSFEASVFMRASVVMRQAIPLWSRTFAETDAAVAAAAQSTSEPQERLISMPSTAMTPATAGAGTEEFTPMDLSEDAWLDLLTNWDGSY
ncbi:unnamed protein product [Clonostachys rosea f. rosea IK726]|uniref:Uncharacterized protein n=1 Tax=Clonostachys rosea f. rosea IK726 TaxID=1349383 RepID=A0ACA9TZ16_BIOOC|nr:unnamed protein product [Clonostachys rosea f. rosea IK726]